MEYLALDTKQQTNSQSIKHMKQTYLTLCCVFLISDQAIVAIVIQNGLSVINRSIVSQECLIIIVSR